MAKGNHVFNSFDKVIHNTYRDILQVVDMGRDLDAIRGSGGNIATATESLQSKFKDSFRFYNEIVGHPKIAELHNTQDDEAVVANDPNSTGFGLASEAFSAAVMKWAMDQDGGNPMDYWRRLVNAGADKTAQDNYIKKGSSALGTPSSETARRSHCVELEKFVKGELGALVRKWLLAIRLDLQTKSKAVTYTQKIREWKDLVN
jgi:hypothetical protein